MAFQDSSSSGVQLPCCLINFNGTNYHEWVSRMHLYMRDLPYPIAPTCPVVPVILDKAVDEAKKKLIADHDDAMSY